MPNTDKPVRRVDQPIADTRYPPGEVPARAEPKRDANPALPPRAVGITIRETDGSPSVSQPDFLDFPAGTLTEEVVGGKKVVTVAVAAGLTVREVDGAPTEPAVTVLEVPNGALTVMSPGVVRLTLAGGALTVQEFDGTPVVTPVTTIQFDNCYIEDAGSGAAYVLTGTAVQRGASGTYLGGRVLLIFEGVNSITDDGDGVSTVTISRGQVCINMAGTTDSFTYVAAEAMTLVLHNVDGPGSVSFTNNGAGDTSPFVLAANAKLVCTLTGGSTSATTTVTLRRTA